MRNVYQTLKDFVIRPLSYIGLATIVLLSGCDNRNSKPKHQAGAEYSFSNFGKVDAVPSNQVSNWHQLRFADLDGDGDLDMILSSLRDGIFIYENRIPQKKRE